MTKVRHFKSLLDINKKEFIRIIERAIALKQESKNGKINDALKNWGLVVGVVEGYLEKSIKYIPKKSTQGLRDWLKNTN